MDATHCFTFICRIFDGHESANLVQNENVTIFFLLSPINPSLPFHAQTHSFSNQNTREALNRRKICLTETVRNQPFHSNKSPFDFERCFFCLFLNRKRTVQYERVLPTSFIRPHENGMHIDTVCENPETQKKLD
mmetsp:Transcript_28121/g.34334  ORF Transcript_28121/g.34334 Transcript_28121/m.34334 type:complete len:134 (+) Transcript_28121:41-442(+)